MKFAIPAGLLAIGLAAPAFADAPDTLVTTGVTSDVKLLSVPGSFNFGGDSTTAAYTSFNVAGIASWDARSDPSNVVVNFDIASALGYTPGTSITMTAIGWDVTLTALGASWQSELTAYFDDNINPDGTGLFLRPGAGTDTPGTGTFTGGPIDLTDNTIPDIVLPNGILRLEFHESFDDVPDAIDGTWDAGVLRIGTLEAAVPEPTSFALLGVAGLGLLRRRRSSR